MPRKRLSMGKIRELLRLKYDRRRSHREIARSLGNRQQPGERLRAAGERGGVLLAIAGGAGRRRAGGGAVPAPAAVAGSPARAGLGAHPPGASTPQVGDAAERYEYAQWRKARVNIDYHIQVEHALYSVPHPLGRCEVDVRLTAQTVDIFHKHRRVAAHLRIHGRGGYATEPSHMPASHRAHEAHPRPRPACSLLHFGSQKTASGASRRPVKAQSRHHDQRGMRDRGTKRLRERNARDPLARKVPPAPSRPSPERGPVGWTVCLGPAQHRKHLNALLHKLRAAQQHGDAGIAAKQRLVGVERNRCTQRFISGTGHEPNGLPAGAKFGLVGFQPDVIPHHHDPLHRGGGLSRRCPLQSIVHRPQSRTVLRIDRRHNAVPVFRQPGAQGRTRAQRQRYFDGRTAAFGIVQLDDWTIHRHEEPPAGCRSQVRGSQYGYAIPCGAGHRGCCFRKGVGVGEPAPSEADCLS